MSGHDSPIAGHIKSRHTEQLLTGLVPASPSLDRIKICCEGKMVPLRVVTWPKKPIRCAQIFGETGLM